MPKVNEVVTLKVNKRNRLWDHWSTHPDYAKFCSEVPAGTPCRVLFALHDEVCMVAPVGAPLEMDCLKVTADEIE